MRPLGVVRRLASYCYFAGTRADGRPIRSPDMNVAAVVVDATVDEISVMWDPYLNLPSTG